jgi:hypothetical protein
VAAGWFGTNMPGFFCDRAATEFPTAELMTTTVNHILTNKRRTSSGVHFDWTRILANAMHFDVWSADECESLRLTLDGSSPRDDPLHIIGCLRTCDLSDDAIAPGAEERPGPTSPTATRGSMES